MPQLFRPLFRLDPGWPFVLAGLAILVAAILIPAQRELHDLRSEAAKADGYEARTYARLMAYDRFLSDLRGGDPQLLRRLAMAQLNLVPKGEESLLLTPGMNQTVAEWIDESVPSIEAVLQAQAVAAPYPDTLLARLALGSNRLWLVAASVFLVFVGLLLGGEESRMKVAPRDASDAEEEDLDPVVDRFVAQGLIEPAEEVEEHACAVRRLFGAEEAIIDVEVIDDEEPELDEPDLDDDEAPEIDLADGRLDASVRVAAAALEDDFAWPTASADSLATPSAPATAPDEGYTRRELEQAFCDRVLHADTERPLPPRRGAD